MKIIQQVLAGDKQRLNRGYNFTKVIEWFASKVDRILCLFDAHKLDVSDEFKQAILALEDMTKRFVSF